MRWMALLTGVLLVAPVFGQDNDAEELYRKMEKKIRSAKAIHVVFDAEMTGEGKKGTANGSLDLAEGNKLRLDASGEFGGNAMKVLAVCDGKVSFLALDGKVQPQSHGPEEGDYAKALGMFARAGAMALMHAHHKDKTDKKEAHDLEKMAAIKDFKAAGKEKIGNHETQPVQYHLDFGKEGTAQVKVWIDTTTDLPVKREMTVMENGKSFRAVERFTTFEVNPMADVKTFQLPK
jgi:outer membrane lipoprotein-sorting protein